MSTESESADENENGRVPADRKGSTGNITNSVEPYGKINPLKDYGYLTPGEYIIRCDNLIKDFEMEEYIIRAINGISLKIRRGEFVIINGHSGAGKTTLLHLIAGLDKPTSGDIYIENVKVSDFGEELMSVFRILNIGIIFQNYNLISTLTTLENIIFPCSLAGMDPEEQMRRGRMLLRRVGLEERADHLPFQLSAGEQQRVGIARALANDAPIILADEPTANLDEENAAIIERIFGEISGEGKTIIIVTHDDRFRKLAHRIITMGDGSIISEEILKESITPPEGNYCRLPKKEYENLFGK